MNRGETLNQIRRILLLAAGRRQPPSPVQLELPLVPLAGPPGRFAGGEHLPEVGHRLHELALELVLLIQMECAGLVESPILERRRRLRLGSAPPLRLLREWNPRSRRLPASRPLQALEAGPTPDRREEAFAVGLARCRQLAESLELGDSEVQEMARRLYSLNLGLAPESDLPGLIHGHGLRHSLVQTARGKPAFQVDRDRSRGHGVFYTPPELIQEIIRAVVDPAIEEAGAGGAEALADLRILDPACGSGQFLLAAAERIVGDPRGAAETISEKLRSLTQLCGVDQDPEAARIAAHNLSVWSAFAYRSAQKAGRGGNHGGGTLSGPALDAILGDYPYLLGTRIQVGNALLIEPSSFSPGFIWENRYPDVFDRPRPGFDVVIGNPPWISYGLRDRAAANGEEREYFGRLFPAGTQYKLTLYPLFMELALRLCRSGGCHGFLVPDSLLTGHHFSRIRQRLLEETDLTELALVESPPWPGAHVGYTVFYAARRRGTSAPAPRNVRNRVLRRAKPSARNQKRRGLPPSFLRELEENEGRTAVNGPVLLEGTEVWVPSEQYRASRGGPLRIFRDRAEMEFLSRVQSTPLCFRDVVWTYSGLIARYGQKSVQARRAEPRFLLRDRSGREVFSDPEAGQCWVRALLSGSEIVPYRVRWRGGRIYLAPDRRDLAKIYKSGFHLERYRKPKVFLRQTGDRLIAALDRSGLYSLNNLHLLGALATVRVPPLLLVGLLMSEPIQRTYRIFALEGSRPLAQVDLTTVESLPYPTDASGYPVGAGDLPPRTHPQSRKILRSIEKWLKARESAPVLEHIERAHQLGPDPFGPGPLRGRDVLTLVLLRILEVLDEGLNAKPGEAAPGSPGPLSEADEAFLLALVDGAFAVTFQVQIPSAI